MHLERNLYHTNTDITEKEKEELKKYGRISYKRTIPITLFDKKGPYNTIYIVESTTKKDKQHFLKAYNIYGTEVFLPKKGIKKTNDEYIYFVHEDGKVLLYIEYPGAGIYFTEDGERYNPLGPIEKLNRKIDNILGPLGKKISNKLSPLLESLCKLLHTELIFKQPEMIKIPERPGNNGIKDKNKTLFKKPKQTK